jgi:hypothetical protein
MKFKKVLNNYIIIKNIDVFKPENKRYDVNNNFDRDVGLVIESSCDEYKKNDVVVYNSKNARVTKMDFLIKGSQEVAVFKEDIIYKIIE